ncbi:hypothetical protein VTO42DRAFT_720 [Malbranchea cinnamomea]
MLNGTLRSVARANRPYVCLCCRLLGVAPVVRTARQYSDAVQTAQSDTGANDTSSQNANTPVRRVLTKAKKRFSIRERPQNDTSENTTNSGSQKTEGQTGRAGKKKAKKEKVGKKSRKKTVQKKGKKRTAAASSKKADKRATRGTRRKATKKAAQKAVSEGTKSPTNEKVIVPLVRSTETLQEDNIQLKELELTPLNTESTAVPRLCYGLDRVLFNPGVYHLQDPRSRVYNFDPYLREIMPVWEFDFDILNEYITSSRDTKLRSIAREKGLKYVGSSSSMTSVLSQFHFLLSWWRPVEISMLSQGFTERHRTFTKLTRAPAAVFLRHKDGVYAIDADKEYDSANILMNLGKSMERLLTMPTEQYERYRKTSQNKMTPDESEDEAYHYTTMGDFLMRAQLDAYDPRLPGTGMFDLKTRAVLSIRMDARNYEGGLGYQLRNLRGDYESFEREYFDMIRSAFLKYSLQVRIGRMDGIFVAYHNTERIFGFQYISLPEMDFALHGQNDTALGDAEFKLSLNLWNKVLNKVTSMYPGQSLRFHFETRETTVPFMYIFAEPLTEEEIDEIQTRNKEEIEAYQKRLLFPELFKKVQEAKHAAGITETESEAANTEETELQSSSVASSTEGEIELSYSKTEGVQIKESASEVETEKEETSKETSSSSSTDDTDKASNRPILAMALSIENRVNGQPVERPINFTPKDKWTVHYRLSAFTPERGRDLYQQCQKRRARIFDIPDTTNEWQDAFRQKLMKLSEEGRKWREEQDRIDREKGIVRLDQ